MRRGCCSWPSLCSSLALGAALGLSRTSAPAAPAPSSSPDSSPALCSAPTVAAPRNAVIHSATGLPPGVLVLQPCKTSGNVLQGDSHGPRASAAEAARCSGEGGGGRAPRQAAGSMPAASPQNQSSIWNCTGIILAGTALCTRGSSKPGPARYNSSGFEPPTGQ